MSTIRATESAVKTSTKVPDLFSGNLAYYVEKRYGTKAAFLRASGVARSTLDSWLSGAVCPEMAKLDDLAFHLGIRVADFFLTPEQLPTESAILGDLVAAAKRAHQELGRALEAVGVPLQVRRTDEEAAADAQLAKTRPKPGRKTK